MYRRFIKRFLDIVFSFVIMIAFSWLYIILAILVRVKLGSPIMFIQDRPGKDERIFKLYKFRSMSDAKDKNGELLPDKERLTRFGKMLRASSLDELPEVWNIFKGEMSFVGPRPWAVQYLQFFTPEEHRRHIVRPGLTGLAQVNGRTAANWGERLKLDIEYVDNLSFWLDTRILLQTVKKVLARADIAGAELQGDFDTYRMKQWELGEVKKPN